ncbi:LOW QUALITY PROTEIN: hypothetical protein TorRG33x02_155630 [Trema orientale]|uniref:Uncharacterized protein n=1 Tax=Trema orientale TaxID=63057 RepID=A0A2P5ESZ3_TREOI|nr:LOW QUALITY PROTEIN: hypothetical protein TorRG33x02_155630 [Trema orientale]
MIRMNSHLLHLPHKHFGFRYSPMLTKAIQNRAICDYIRENAICNHFFIQIKSIIKALLFTVCSNNCGECNKVWFHIYEPVIIQNVINFISTNIVPLRSKNVVNKTFGLFKITNLAKSIDQRIVSNNIRKITLPYFILHQLESMTHLSNFAVSINQGVQTYNIHMNSSLY